MQYLGDETNKGDLQKINKTRKDDNFVEMRSVYNNDIMVEIFYRESWSPVALQLVLLIPTPALANCCC